MTWTQVGILAYFCKDLTVASQGLIAALKLLVRIQQFPEQVFTAAHKAFTTNDRLKVNYESKCELYATFTAVTKHPLQRHFGGVRQHSFNKSGVEVKLWLNPKRPQWELTITLFRVASYVYLTIWIRNENDIRIRSEETKQELGTATLLEVAQRLELFQKDIS